MIGDGSFAILIALTIVALPLTAAGVYWTVQLHGSIARRSDQNSGIFSRAISRNGPFARESRILLLDLLSVPIILGLLSFVWLEGPSPTEIVVLLLAMISQGLLALSARSRSCDTLELERSPIGRPSAAYDISWNKRGGCDVHLDTAEKQPMSHFLTRQERTRLIQLSQQKFERIRPELERLYPGQRVAISTKTGRYTSSLGGGEFEAFLKNLENDDRVWIVKVGTSTA